MTVHPTAEAGYSNVSDAYHRGRPEYPAAIGAWMREALTLAPESRIVELGAGTGKFTKAMLAAGFAVTAVEPVVGMREKLHRHYSRATILDGTAEATNAPAASADAVVAAQAFHWFSSEATLRECARILKPRGWLILLWNMRDDSVSWVREFDRIIEAYAGSTPRFISGEWKKPFTTSNLFAPLRQQSFRHVQAVTVETMVDRAFSTSFIATLPDSEKEHIAEDIRRRLSGYSGPGSSTEFPLPYLTHVYYCQRT